MFAHVFYVSIPCALRCCAHFVHSIQQAKVLAVPRPILVAEALYGAGPLLHTAIVFGE